MANYFDSYTLDKMCIRDRDKAMDMVVNSIEKALDKYLRDNHRHGVVHCQLTTSDLLNRFRDLKLHAYIQSIFLDYDINIVEDKMCIRDR